MLPTIHIFNRTIAMYGFWILIGIITGITAALHRRKKYTLSSDDILFSSCYAGIGLMIGAKLLYVMTVLPDIISYREQLLSKPFLIINILSGGFVFYGGLIGAIAGYVIYCRQYHISMISLLDFMTPSFPLIHAFGRIGCFFAGCCYGISYEGFAHIIFEHSTIAPNGVPLLPIQLIESSLLFLLSLYLFQYGRTPRRPGHMLGCYIMVYTLIRFILEFFRGDLARGSLLGISTSQWISLILLPLGLFLLYLYPQGDGHQTIHKE
ncbi:MAG: lgt2 [Herbinix sp.]|nr:lgt2 [Herbinix sp.]